LARSPLSPFKAFISASCVLILLTLTLELAFPIEFMTLFFVLKSNNPPVVVVLVVLLDAAGPFPRECKCECECES
jgi:hypothetical protein